MSPTFSLSGGDLLLCSPSAVGTEQGRTQVIRGEPIRSRSSKVRTPASRCLGKPLGRGRTNEAGYRTGTALWPNSGARHGFTDRTKTQAGVSEKTRTRSGEQRRSISHCRVSHWGAKRLPQGDRTTYRCITEPNSSTRYSVRVKRFGKKVNCEVNNCPRRRKGAVCSPDRANLSLPELHELLADKGKISVQVIPHVGRRDPHSVVAGIHRNPPHLPPAMRYPRFSKMK
jgi:hypothetical protein